MDCDYCNKETNVAVMFYYYVEYFGLFELCAKCANMFSTHFVRLKTPKTFDCFIINSNTTTLLREPIGTDLHMCGYTDHKTGKTKQFESWAAMIEEIYHPHSGEECVPTKRFIDWISENKIDTSKHGRKAYDLNLKCFQNHA